MDAREDLDIGGGAWELAWRSPLPGVAARVRGHRLAGASPVDLAADAARLDQVHGATVVVATAPGPAGAGDALVTVQRELRLLIRVADCVPVFLASPGGVALAHAGWRGTVGGIAAAALAALVRETGDRPEEVSAWIGPAIGRCCYEVGDEVARHFSPAHLWTGRARPHVDLPAANRDQLAAAGVPVGRIEGSRYCTRCHQHLFHSHRGSGGQPGRIVATIHRAGPPA